MKKHILTRGIQFFLKPDTGSGEGGGGEGEGEHIHDQEGDGEQNREVVVDKSERFAKFREQFTVKKNASVDQGGSKDNKPTQDQINQSRADTERIARERAEQKRQSEQAGEKIKDNKRPGSNFPKVLEDKRKAELERDDFKSKVDKYEKEEKPALEAKIQELNEKIEKGVSAKKEAELTSKITELETQMREKEDSLVNENQSLKKRLAFYNLSEDYDFKEKYEKPVIDAHRDAVENLTDDKQRAMLRQAVALNAQYLRSTDANEKSQIRQERDSLLSAIQDDLKGFAGSAFFGAMMRYIKGSEEHAKALQNHEETTQEIRKRAQEQADRARADRLASWDKTYKVTAQQFDKDTEFTDDEKTILKDLQIDVDESLKEAGVVAGNVVIGKSRMEDAIEMIHKGRVYDALKAKQRVLEKKLQDRDAIITKLRGSSTQGGDTSGSNGEGSGQRKDEKQTREQWQSKFSASRVK